MQKNTLKRTLGKAGYKSLLETRIRIIRSIIRQNNTLSKWYRVPGGLRVKLSTLRKFINHNVKYARKLSDSDYYLAYGRKAHRFDKVDFINNQYSPYLPR